MHDTLRSSHTPEAAQTLAQVEAIVARHLDLDAYDTLLANMLERQGSVDPPPTYMAALERSRQFQGMPDTFQPRMYKRGVDDEQGGIHPTRLESFTLDGVGTVWDKREDTHPFVQAFKVRGALFHVLAELEENPKVRTFVAHSSGNHARGLAATVNLLNTALVESGQVRTNKFGEIYEEDAGKLFKAVIFCNKGADASKIAANRSAGAEVYNSFDTLEMAGDAAAQFVSERPSERAFIHPFDTDIIKAGQSTVMLETLLGLAAQGVDLRARPVVMRVAVGGGGKLVGQLAHLPRLIGKGLLHPGSRVIAVEAYNNDSLRRGLLKKKGLTSETLDVLAGGTATLRSGRSAIEVVREYGQPGARVDLVGPEDMLRAMQVLAQAHGGTPPEFAGVMSLASLMKRSDREGVDPNAVHVTVTCGGNGSAPLLQRTLERWRAATNDERVRTACDYLGSGVFKLMSAAALIEPYPAPAIVSRDKTTNAHRPQTRIISGLKTK